MLSRQEAIGILAEYGHGAEWTRHCFAVADTAIRVGSVLKSHHAIDCPFLWSAALLHDIGRYVTHDPILHGVEGYKLLSMLGHQKEARVCASHILFGLSATESEQFGLPGRDFVPRTIEEQLVPLVDFLIEFDQPSTLERRFSSLRRRNAGNHFFLNRLDRAHESARHFMKQIELEIEDSVERIVASQGNFS